MNRAKKYLALFLGLVICLLLLPVPVLAGYEEARFPESEINDETGASLKLIPSVAEAGPGETVDVAVNVAGNPGIMFLQLRFTYDTNRLEAPTFTANMDGWQFGTGAAWGGSQDESFNGTAFTMHFKVKDGASAGTADIQISSLEAFNENEQPVAFTVSGTSVTVRGAGAEEGSVTLVPSVTEARPGDTVDVAVNVAGNPGIMFLQMRFAYDTERLEAPSFTANMDGWQFGTGAAWGGSQDESFNGTVFTMHFKVKDGAPAGTADIQISSLEAFNENEQPVTFTAVGTTVTVREPGIQGFGVSLDRRFIPDTVTVSLVDGALYSGETTFTVASEDDRAVLVAVKTADEYEVLPCTTDSEGVHHFTVNVTGETELALIFRGDANGDKKVNMRDSLAIKKHTAGTELLSGLFLMAANADGGSDGRVNMRDSLAIKKDTAGTEKIKW